MKLLKVHKECSKLYSYRSKILTFSTFSTFSRSNIFHSFDSYGSFQFCSNSSAVTKWAIPEKIETGVEDMLFWNPWNFSFFFYFTPGNSRQNKAQPLDIPQNCVRSLGNSKAKNKDPWKFHIIFSWSPLEIPLHF